MSPTLRAAAAWLRRQCSPPSLWRGYSDVPQKIFVWFGSSRRSLFAGSILAAGGLGRIRVRNGRALGIEMVEAEGNALAAHRDAAARKIIGLLVGGHFILMGQPARQRGVAPFAAGRAAII